MELLSQNGGFLFHTATFMFFVSYLYGYGISFIFGIRKTFAISFFIVIITAILLLFYDSGYVFITQCFNTTGSHCFNPTSIIQGLFFWLIIFVTNFFINIVIGTIGVGVGILFYFPSEYILSKYFGVTFHEEESTTVHTENYTPSTNTAAASGVNAFLKMNRSPMPSTTQESKQPLMPPQKIIKT